MLAAIRGSNFRAYIYARRVQRVKVQQITVDVQHFSKVNLKFSTSLF